MPQSPSLLVTIFAFLLVLGPLVLIHELGHYLVGRLFKVKADAFSVGFGKELLGRTDRHGTRWKLSAIPLGGYVQFAGDANASSIPNEVDSSLTADERSVMLQFKPLWQRALVVLAGPLTNLFAAVAIFAAFNVIYGQATVTPVIAAFAEGAAAKAAGLQVGDKIVSIDGAPTPEMQDVQEQVLPYPGKDVSVVIERAGRNLTVPVKIAEIIDTDQFGNESRIGRLGIQSGKVAFTTVGPLRAVGMAFEQSLDIVRMMVTGIKQIIVGDRSVKEMGGPIKIAKFSGEQFTLGWPQFTYFVALISINLAFINLLPIPGLDGGHLAFYAAEAVRRKPLSLRSQEWAFRTGMALVLMLMVFVTINDVISLPLFARMFGG